MKTGIKFEKIEKDALKVISEVRCPVIPCAECPLHYDKNDVILCLKGVCQSVLEDYLNQD